MYQCAHCGIAFNFYDQGYIFIDKAGERTSRPYESLKEVEQIMNGLQQQDVQIGISKTSNPERLIDIETFRQRYEERETVDFIQNGELTSHLQPIIDLKTGELIAFESLLRAKSAEKPISPGQLFGTAQKTGLHSLLDQRAREEAIKARVGRIPSGIKSFINFLPSTIYNPDFCLQHTFKIVKKYGIDPSDLVFEVVETENIDNVNHLENVLKRYKQEGMKVALDDVGSGFATLDMLSKLQPDYVKIDRSYIDHCDQDLEKQSFLKEAFARANSLGITALAEGIERVEELEFCRSIGYELAQGYYIGKPSAEPNLQVKIAQ